MRTHFTRRVVGATAVAALAITGAISAGSSAGAATTTASDTPPSPGSAGIGDPYYPFYGNGGYDVAHYDIDLDYTPATDKVRGRTRILGTATQRLTSFNLDFALPVTAVRVNGITARFRASTWHEVTVIPRAELPSGSAMSVEVDYAGTPSKVRPSGPMTLTPWIRTDDGVVGLGEPEIAAWWYPSNDHPRDKATFDISLTVPRGLEALSGGRLLGVTTAKGKDTWAWRVSSPMTTYLAYLVVGQFDIQRSTTRSGLPVINAVASGSGIEVQSAKKDLARTASIVDWHSGQWGRYPFDALGGVAPDSDFGFALETQTRPVYSREFWAGGESNIGVVVHELGHQWFGDSVSVRNWRDIWLNEGFATFTQWRYDEDVAGVSANSVLRQVYRGIPADNEFWKLAIGNPGAANEFAPAVYERGAMTLQALRRRIGDRPFFTIMRSWAAAHAGGNASIRDFITLATAVSGQNLDSFFNAWLYRPTRPAATADNGLDPAWGGGAANARELTTGEDARAAATIAEMRAVREMERRTRR
jgi:aminopeptidase N